MSDELVKKSEERDYSRLFRYDLNWGAPDLPPITVELEHGYKVTATNVSSYKGLRVWEVPATPGSSVEAELDRAIAATTTNRLVIFHEPDKQVWRWPSRTTRDGSVIARSARHVHRTGRADRGFGDKLDAIRLPDDVDVDANAVLTRVRTAFDIETKSETKRASRLMVRMYEALEKAYPGETAPRRRDHEISVTLARVLFLMFGDDTEMWETNLFQDFIKDRTGRDGSDIGEKINQLFRVLDTSPGKAREEFDDSLVAFPHVNGGIFHERLELPDLNKDFRDAVLDASVVDWSTISPAIFGSMFQSVRDAQTRRELGEHYTSEENILKTLNPLFLDELRAEFEHIRTLRVGQRQKLNSLWKRLGDIRFMDPACGCGNFIIVAYRELRELELRIMDALATLNDGEQAQALTMDWTHMLKVTLDHFYGIEVDEWPARIAETAMFLMDRQCDLRMIDRFGVAPERLPIEGSAQIVVGNALKLDWKQVCPPSDSVVVAGNPPFLGHATRTEEQAAELRNVWETNDISRLDYVTGWHAQALNYFGHGGGVWAFVTTNSITQGDPVPHLFGPIFKAGWQIKFAHRTFRWTSESSGAAAVHCVIVGFARSVDKATLHDSETGGPSIRQVPLINAYLADGPNVFIVKRMQPLSEGLPEATFGNMPRDGGHLIVAPEEVDEVLADPVAAKYLRRFIGADELLNGRDRWCLWLVGAENDLDKSTLLRRRVDAVRNFRAESTASSTRQMAMTPHLFGQRPALYELPYVVIPRVSSDRRPYYAVMHVQADVIASDATFTAADADGYLFGLLSSAMFIAWQRAVGGRLKSDLRFSNTIVWNNFPVPDVTPDVRAAIATTGEAVSAARALRPELTLAQQYLQENFGGELAAAHRELDRLVDAVFAPGLAFESEADRQGVLFSLYARFEAGLF